MLNKIFSYYIGMKYLNPFSAWFTLNKEQIKNDYFKISSLSNELNVKTNQKAKQLWSNMTDVEKNEWKNKIEIIEEVKPQQLTKLVLKTPTVKKTKKYKKKTKKKGKKNLFKKRHSVKNNPAFLPPLINNNKRGPKLRNY